MQEAEKKIPLKKEGSWVRDMYLKKKLFMVSLDSSIYLIFVLGLGFGVWFWFCFGLFLVHDKNEFEETLCLYLN